VISLKPLKSLSLFLLAILFTSLCSGVAYGASAPDFTITDIDSRTFSLSDFRGKVVLLEFFTTWCTTCKDELPDFKTVRNHFGGELVMISLSHDDDNAELIEYRDTHQIPWIVAECSWSLYQEYEVPGVPTIFVISPEGAIAYRHTGSFDPSVIIQKITEQLAATPEPPVTPDPEPPVTPNPEPPVTPDPDNDTVPPVLVLLAPENKTYSITFCTGNCTAAVPLTFSVSEPTAWIAYEFDNQSLVQINKNTTIGDLLDGPHKLVVYAVDLAGNNAIAQTVHFTIDTTPPLITEISQTPLKNNVTLGYRIEINATVVDTISEVKHVTLNYSHCSVPWLAVTMINLEGNLWSANIPSFEYCDNATYLITMEDTIGNVRTSEELQFEVETDEIPEFPTFLLPPLFTIATLLAFIFRKKLTNNKETLT